MGKNRILPPTYLFVSILIIIGLHLLLPACKVIRAPYTYSGVILIIVGVFLNIRSDNLFKKADTTVKPFRKPSSLIIEGPYRISRHPMYLGMVAALLGLAVLLGTLTPMLVAPVFGALMDRIFIVPEEKDMEETFGDGYREYKKTVRRWI